MNTATGTFFDGNLLRGHPVALEFMEPGTLRISGENIGREVPLADVRISDRLGDVPRFLYLADHAVIETSDNAAVDAAFRADQRTRAARAIHLLEAHRTFAAVACVVVVLLLAAGLYYGPPRLAQIVAHRIPPALDARAGEIALAALQPYFGPTTLSAAERARVARQLQRLRPKTPAAGLPRLEFRTMTGSLPNAFALPGNVIVVTDQLVRLPASDNELAAVLAHELGHLEHRHGMQGLLRNSFALLLVTAVTGDLSTLTSLAAAIPISILTTGYSRDLEREADRYALELLRERAIDAGHFTSILRKLDSARQALGRNSTYLSTHPSSEERAALFGAPPTLPPPPPKKAELASGESLPVPVRRVRPVYPAAMRAAGVAAEVVVDFVVDETGDVQGAHVIRSSNPGFDAAALAAVTQWKFRPGRKNFLPVATHMQVPIQFTLDETPPKKRP